jgi:hypothetical protein
MTNLSPLNRFRTLYYEKNLRIVDVRQNNDHSLVEFSDGDETIVVESSDEEFVSVVSQLVRTVRDGEKCYIDVRDTPISNKEEFQSNLKKFNVSANDIEQAKKRINNQTSELPEELDFRYAIDACLESDFDDPYLTGIIENYADAMVLLKHRKRDLANPQNHSILRQAGIRTDVVMQYKQKFDDIFESYLFQYSPLEAGRIYREEFYHDMGFLLERLNNINEFENKEWNSLVESDSTLSEDLTIDRILRSYAKRYEILRDVLRDYAYLLKKDSNDDVDLNSTTKVIRYMDERGYSFIQNVIIPEFRNGISHESMRMEDGILQIYEERIKAKEPKRELPAPEVADNFNKFYELFQSVIFSYSVKEEELFFNIFSSEEFKHYVARNYI